MADIDVSLLQSPEIIKTLDYEAILTATKERLVVNFAAKGIDYDVVNLETDPAVIIAETKAYDELLMYAAINDAARSNLLFYATGGDLDHLVVSDVVRMTDETDARLRQRYILARLGRSEERYKSAAMNAHVNVEDVSVYRTGSGPELGVALLSSDNDGIASAEIIAAVDTAIQTTSGRSINDIITVGSAVRTQVDITANVWIEHTADYSIISLLEDHVKSSWNALSVMGLNLVPSWILRELHRVGVQRVELVGFDAPIDVSDQEAISINSVTINYMGRDY